MSNLTDHVSYIKGLAEGMKLDTNTNEGMMISKMLEVMAEMAQENAQLRKDLDELNEYVESIDDDLAEMEEALYGDEDEDDEDGDSCDCGHCHTHHDGEQEEEKDDDDRVVEYTCPHCGEEMTFEVDNFDFDEDYLCPNCHQPLFPEEDEDEEKSEDEDKDDDQ